MARLRDVLDRFRPTGTPGAPAVGGVPADRAADQAAELAGVFEILRDDEVRACEIRDQAAHTAEQRRADGVARAAAIVEQARRDGVALRARIVTEARAQAASEQEQAQEEAAREAAELRQRAEAVMPEYVARVRAELDVILRELGESA
ncbi:hypothetical protein DMH04_17760 [Kibdelosporangium aridum]|uniref:Uncharacterized protein n=1 Tax=Kibdelosporangium aridum TaxID=2030 RepID=A0A428ZAR5_KIBAR|nr:hypothetical protein [Kibdelosporangium aridum]RSM85149.1 hypothetical protein DMH04_17760 [Kibdelosporangium aridum]